MTVEDKIIQMYLEGKSPYEISELIPSWNHMKIRRWLRKIGIQTRNKSEGQKNALQSGRAKSPKKKLS